MQTIKVVEIVSDTVVEEFKDLAHAYEKRDELQEQALRLGFSLSEKRYGIRQN